ncbi:MAG: RNA polymerase sigma factor [Nannocystaceae bacterium]
MENRSDDVDFADFSAWSRGDKVAGNALYKRYFDRLWRFFTRRASQSAVEELVQQTWLALSGSRDRLIERTQRGECEVRFCGYLFGTARNVLYTYYRSCRKLQGIDPMLVTLKDVRTSLSVKVSRQLRNESVQTAILSLPVELQLMLDLRYTEGLTDREIAEAFEIPVGTLKSRLRKARKMLANELSGQGLTPETAL